MRASNVDIVRRALVANRSGPPETTVEAAVALAHPDLEFTSRVSAVEGGTYHGPEGIRRYYSDLAEAFDEWRTEPQEIEELGPDLVLADAQVRAIGKGSRLPVGLRTITVCTLSDGKLIRIDVYRDREEALEAAGFEG